MGSLGKRCGLRVTGVRIAYLPPRRVARAFGQLGPLRKRCDESHEGSNPSLSSTRNGAGVRFNGTVLKTVVPTGTVGSNPTRSAPGGVPESGYWARLLSDAAFGLQEFESPPLRSNALRKAERSSPKRSATSAHVAPSLRMISATRMSDSAILLRLAA